jgi:hypothetical protein
VFENRKEGAGLHTLKINVLTTVTERHQVLLNGVAMGMGELRAKVGLPPGKWTKFARGTAGDKCGTLEIKLRQIPVSVQIPDVNLNSSVSASVIPSLWTGRTTGRGDHHSDQLLVRGFLKFRPPRGCCKVHGAGPNLWFTATGVLGFRVTTVRCAYTPFVDLKGSFCGGAQSLLS